MRSAVSSLVGQVVARHHILIGPVLSCLLQTMSSTSSDALDAVHERSTWEKANPLTIVGGNRPYHVMSVLAAVVASLAS